MAALVGLVIEAQLGSVLAGESGGYSHGYLGGHVGLAIALVLLTGWALGVAARGRGARLRGSAALTHLATLGATVSGFVFLFAGQANAALYGMEGLAGLAIVGSILLIVLGSVELRPGGPSAS